MRNVRWTPHQVREFTRCKKDPWYFIENYCWLERESTAEVLPFNLLPFQVEILNELKLGNNILVNKSRRVGWSWILAAFSAWETNFHKGVKILLLSRTEEDAIAVLDKVKFILNNVAYHDADTIEAATSADWLVGAITTSNQSMLVRAFRNPQGKISHLSSVVSLTNTDQSGRGRGCKYLFMDEFAFYDHDWITWRAISKTVIGGGTWAVGSSPNGVGNKFHKMVSDAKLGENIRNGKPLWKYIEVHWSESWISAEEVEADKATSDAEDAAQEWELEFRTSGNPVFDPTHLANCYKPIEEYPELERELEKYREKVFSGDGITQYYSGADTMMGKLHRKSSEKDYNSFTALTDSGIQAHHYSSQESLDSWAGHEMDNPAGGKVKIPGTLSGLHKDHPGILKIEEQGGGDVAYALHELPADGMSEVYKFQQVQKTKWGGVERLKIAVNTHQLIITSLRTYMQMQVFQDNGPGANRYSAPPSYNDDDVLSLIISHENMLANGGREFSWGADATVLTRSSDSGKVAVTDKEITQMYGPMASVETMQMSRRLADDVGGPGQFAVPEVNMPAPDLDLMREMNASNVDPFSSSRNKIPLGPKKRGGV